MEEERKKQSELEEKERKTKEREEKKKKEEEMKKKAEQRAKKAEEKTKKASSNGKRAVAVRMGKEKAITQPIETVASSSSDTPRTSDILVLEPLKKRRLQESEEIDVNECCMCFGT